MGGGVLLTLLDSKALAQCPSFIAESKLFPFWAPDLLDFRGYYLILTPNLENTLVKDRACISMYPNITKYFAWVVLICFRCLSSLLTRSLVAFLAFGVCSAY